MKYITTRLRLTCGLVSIVISALLLSTVLGILPDRRRQVLDGRATLCETVAVNASIMVTRLDLHRFEAMLRTIVDRKPNVASAAVRRADGKVMVEVGEHQAHWTLRAGDRSTETQIHVPIREKDKRWGSVEMRFAPVDAVGPFFWLRHPQVRQVLFVSGAVFVLMFFYLARMLRHLDPSRAVPDHVRSAFDTLAEGLLVLDTKQCIVLVNQAFADALGKPPKTLVGLAASELPWLTERESNDGPEFPWQESLDPSGSRAQHMLRLQTETAGVRAFMVNCSPVLEDDGQRRGTLVSLDDVTRLEIQEMELRKSKDAADAANRAKSEFLANMSHEIRTPMNAILGFTEILLRDLVGSPQERRKHLGTIHRSGKFLLELINDILDLSKVEAGRLTLEKDAFNPYQILRDTIDVLRVRAEERELTLELSVEGTIPETIQSDPTRVRQIVTNLVGNAIKFTETGGVRVAARFVHDEVEPQLALDVIDTGIGISPEALQSIFNPFEQADGSITRRFGGTGLGLAISKKFAEALGGGLTVRSEPGRGSTFTATVDTGCLDGVKMLDFGQLASRVETVNVQPSATGNVLPSARILVADDAEANRDLVRLILTRAGAQVDTANNGKEAVDMAGGGAYDLILMDMQMPVMDGYTAVRTLRDAGLQIPIYALTANVMQGEKDKCHAAGCSGHLSKPIDIDTLIRTVAQELGTAESPDTARRGSPDTARRGSPGSARRGSPDPAEVPDAARRGSPGSANPFGLSTGQDDSGAAQRRGVARPEEPSFETPLGSREREAEEPSADDPEFRKILATFFITLGDDLRAIRGGRDAGDLAAVARAAHSIRGAAGTFGYPEISLAAERLEESAEQGRTDAAEAAFAELQSRVAEVLPQAEATLSLGERGGGYPDGEPRNTTQRGAAESTSQFPGPPPSPPPEDEQTVDEVVSARTLSQPAGTGYQGPPLVSTLPTEDPAFRDVVETFVVRVQEKLREMQSALDGGNFPELAALAHWLKGSGGTVGFAEFTEPARRLEELAKQKRRDPIGPALEELKQMAAAIVVPTAAETEEPVMV